jgi:hypothetical protein
MMFSRPNDIESALIGHSYHIEGVTLNVRHIQTFIHTFHIDCQLKSHDSPLFLPENLPLGPPTRAISSGKRRQYVHVGSTVASMPPTFPPETTRIGLSQCHWPSPGDELIA